ncbi:hypothetical protein ABT033_35230 [Streptomyces pharetrae]|uniref:hypothetical protein n=1 Tax=Streptomyces pharetrae TaxID=291370 RepID=UPI00334B18CB
MSSWAPRSCSSRPPTTPSGRRHLLRTAGALAWLVRRARGGNADDGGAAFALAALGLLLLAVRVAAAHPWPAVAPAVMTGGALAQAVVLGLLVTALVTVGLRQRGRAVPDGARESAQR